jgi:hypothetical protein
MEHLTDSQFEQYADEYNEKLGSVNRIIVSEKVSCLFNLNAQLFKMAAPIDEDDKEEKEEWSRCNSCGEGSAGANMFSDKKLDHCNFCGELACKKCLEKKKPWPMNKSKTGKICLSCNKKFLFREILDEVTHMVGMKDA